MHGIGPNEKGGRLLLHRLKNLNPGFKDKKTLQDTEQKRQDGMYLKKNIFSVKYTLGLPAEKQGYQYHCPSGFFQQLLHF